MEREIMKKLFLEACEKNTQWAQLPLEKRESIIRKIERNCYNGAVAACINDGIDRNFKTGKVFVERYQTNCYKILSNLDIDSSVNSDYLLNSIINEKIDLNNIIELDSYGLCPEASQETRNEINLRKQQKIEQKVSYRYICRKCGHNESIPLEYAPRAADEATSISWKCVKCENTWRQ